MFDNRGATNAVIIVHWGLVSGLAHASINLYWGALYGDYERFFSGVGDIVRGGLIRGQFGLFVNGFFGRRLLTINFRFGRGLQDWFL